MFVMYAQVWSREWVVCSSQLAGIKAQASLGPRGARSHDVRAHYKSVHVDYLTVTVGQQGSGSAWLRTKEN